MNQYGERRRAQRVDAQLPLKLYLEGGGDAAAPADVQTINISTSGVYFHSDRFVAPMTKLAMSLEVSVPGDQADRPDLALVQCEGIVVRTDPEQETPGARYEVAVFFTWFEAEGRVILSEHIAMLLAGA